MGAMVTSAGGGGATVIQVQTIVDAAMVAITPVTTLSGRISFTGGANDTFSAWNQIVAAATVTKDIPPFGVYLVGCLTPLTTATAGIRIQVGLGGAGSEVSIAEVSSSNCAVDPAFVPFSLSIPRSFPAGSRLSCRVSNGHATSNAAVIFSFNIGQVA